MKSSSALVVGLILASLLSACSSPTSPSAVSGVPFSTTDLRVGTGAEATAGKTATVNYTGWLYSATATENKGTRFDGGTFTFVVGGGSVISGFNAGVTGMKVGGLRRVVIPPSPGYGSTGSGAIPPNATLVFDLELLSVQ